MKLKASLHWMSDKATVFIASEANLAAAFAGTFFSSTTSVGSCFGCLKLQCGEGKKL